MGRHNRMSMSDQKSSFIGTLDKTGMHEHGAVVLLSGLSGPIDIEFETQTLRCRSVLIDANVRHSLDCRGEVFSANYFEVHSPEAVWLRQHYLQRSVYQVDLVAPSLLFKQSQHRILSADLSLMLSRSAPMHVRDLDWRICESIRHMNTPEYEDMSYGDLAQAMALSPSRFRHLFKSETGVSIKRYRLWRRLAAFMRVSHSAGNMTDLALAAGFYDASHLGNSFKKLVGLSPSQILSGLDQLELT